LTVYFKIVTTGRLGS